LEMEAASSAAHSAEPPVSVDNPSEPAPPANRTKRPSLRGIFQALKGGRPPVLQDADRSTLQKMWAICLNNRLAGPWLDRMEAAIRDPKDADHESAMRFMCLCFGESHKNFIAPPANVEEPPPPAPTLPWATEDAQRMALQIIDGARRGATLDATLAGAAAAPHNATAAESAA
jgi:hypothetical protein